MIKHIKNEIFEDFYSISPVFTPEKKSPPKNKEQQEIIDYLLNLCDLTEKIINKGKNEEISKIIAFEKKYIKNNYKLLKEKEKEKETCFIINMIRESKRYLEKIKVIINNDYLLIKELSKLKEFYNKKEKELEDIYKNSLEYKKNIFIF